MQHRIIRFHCKGSDLRWARGHRQRRALARFRGDSTHSMRPDEEYADLLCSTLAEPYTRHAIVAARTRRLKLLHCVSDKDHEGAYSRTTAYKYARCACGCRGSLVDTIFRCQVEEEVEHRRGVLKAM